MKIIAAAGVFGIGVPAVLYGISFVPGIWIIGRSILSRLMWGSIAMGGLLVLILLVLVIIEQIQDDLLYRMYRKDLGKRIRGTCSASECPYCGNRNVQDFERTCRVCGRGLSE